MSTDAHQRLKAIAAIALDILALGDSDRDERFSPELRDCVRLAQGEEPRTTVGKQAWAEASAEPEG